MEQREYNTKQKQILINYLKDHPNNFYSAEELFVELFKLDQKISRATIYRALEHFTTLGLITKYDSSAIESAHYQYKDDDCKEHIHLKCVECGKLVHAELDEINNLDNEANTKYGFYVQPEKLVIYGVCEDCHEKNN